MEITVQNSPEIKAFLREKKTLFWWIQQDEIENVDIKFMVEQILNYGDDQDVKRLFELVGIEKVADIFYQQTNRERVNYKKQVVNYFNLYFKKYVPQYSDKRAS